MFDRTMNETMETIDLFPFWSILDVTLFSQIFTQQLGNKLIDQQKIYPII